MEDETNPGHTVQSGRIIELTNSAQPMYFSEKLGRDYGSPGGGWSADRDQATVMSQADADDKLLTVLHMVAPFCKVVTA